MRNIPFSPPDISEAEINEVCEALRSGWITTGPRTKKLEDRLKAFVHSSGLVCMNSATAVEELNLRLLGVGEGDEVLVPAYTYSASASAALHVGATVRFIDSAKDSTEMDYDAMADAITERTKAIVPVDIGGIPCDYERIEAVLESKKSLFRPASALQEAIGRVAVCEDAAHALGASYHGRRIGEISDFTTFSFHAVKNFTTAEGGASAWREFEGIDSRELYHQLQLLSLHGQSKDAMSKMKAGAWEYDIVGPWYKCNMTDIHAALGLVQLDRYPDMLVRRREIIGKFDAAMDALGVKHLTHYTQDYTSSGHLYLVRIPGFDVPERNAFITKMAEMGVATNVHYKPLPMMTAYKNLGWDIKDFPNAYDYYRNEVSLPLYSLLSDDDVDYIIDCTAKALAMVRG